MSSFKGRTFVSFMTLGPVASLALVHFTDPQRWHGIPRSLVLLGGLLWALATYRITIPYFTSPLRHLPTAPPEDESYFLGIAVAVNTPPRGKFIINWIDNIPNSGLVYARGLLQGFPGVVLTSAESLQEALVTRSYDFEKAPMDRRMLTKFLGRGLIVVEAAEHKFQRKHVQPAFSGKQINELIPVFWSKSKEFAQVLADQLDVAVSESKPKRSGIVGLDSPASRVTLDIIGLACLGRDFNAIHNSGDKIVEQYEKVLMANSGESVMTSVLTFLLPSAVARRIPFLPLVRAAADGSHWLRILCTELMQAKRRDPDLHSTKHTDIISMLMRSGQFSDDQLVDQIMTFLAAGHETTSNALCWTMHLLATHPECQHKLRDELQAHFGKVLPTTVSAADLDSLPYLGAVVSEQLRLWPVVPITGREAVRDTSLVGQFIPKGTIILLSPWAINRSKTFWGESATSFQPERWLSEEGQEVPFAGKGAFSNLTFLHGPRSCIGQAFSRAELKCLIISMVMRFTVEMADPQAVIETAGMITIKPKHGLKLKLQEL